MGELYMCVPSRALLTYAHISFDHDQLGVFVKTVGGLVDQTP